LQIESFRSGWTYTNQLPDGNRIFTVFTDSDLIEQDKTSFFDTVFSESKWYKDQKRIHILSEIPITVYDARTMWNEQQAGSGWIGVGDSAYSIDPLSGRGIEKNLDMVIFICKNLLALMDRKESSIANYREYNTINFNSFLRHQEQVYDLEHRWENEFWNRRNPIN
jgi:hypothetical protein